jgi:fructoselysine 6-kinase
VIRSPPTTVRALSETRAFHPDGSDHLPTKPPLQGPGAPLATMGDCCIDVYASEGFRAVGGNALNVAVQWSFAGHRTQYFGAVGNDDGGRTVRHALAAAGVELDGLQALDGATGVTHIELCDDGDRVLAHEDFGVAAEYAPTATDLERLAGARWLHAATLPAFRRVARVAASHGVPVSYDFSTRHETEALDDLEVAFYSWDGPPEGAAAELARSAVAGGARTAVVTCGRYGSLVAAGDRLHVAAAIEAPVVDTCGAGDSFVAAFVLATCAGLPIDERMESAAVAAARTCGHLAAWPQDLRRITERSL